MPKEKKFKYMEEEPNNTIITNSAPADTDKACKLILECMDLNRIRKSAAVSAMATLMISIYTQLETRTPFDEMMTLCRKLFDQEWAFKMESKGSTEST